MDAKIYCEYRYEGGETWWLIAEFQIGSAASFNRAMAGAGLAGRGLPSDLSESVQIGYAPYAELATRYPCDGPHDQTWFAPAELPLLLVTEHWLSERDRAAVPLQFHADYAELDTVRAWQALAQVASGNPVRFVVWFSG